MIPDEKSAGMEAKKRGTGNPSIPLAGGHDPANPTATGSMLRPRLPAGHAFAGAARPDRGCRRQAQAASGVCLRRGGSDSRRMRITTVPNWRPSEPVL